MSEKHRLITELIDGLSSMMEFREPPEEIAGVFASWLSQVSCTLQAARMDEELEIWNEVTKQITYSAEDTSFWVHVTVTKAVLLGFLSKVSGIEPASALFPIEIIQDAKSYIQQIAVQANGCYERGWFDACAVMLRKLIEMLIIECFERYSIESKIKSGDGNFLKLEELVNSCVVEPTWTLSRGTKKSLPKLRDMGNLSAHSRYFIAKRKDIEALQQDIRTVLQELVIISSVIARPTSTTEDNQQSAS